MDDYLMIPREQLLPPEFSFRANPADGALDDLVHSIRENGILEPLLVTLDDEPTGVSAETPAPSGQPGVARSGPRYRILAGERRYLASARVPLHDLPCRVLQADAAKAWVAMLHTNIMRQDPTAAEEGLVFLRLVNEQQWSLTRLCREFDVSEQYVQDRVDLVTGDEDVAVAVAAREISFSVGRLINKCKDPERRRAWLADAISHGSSAREINYKLEQVRRDEAIALGQPVPNAGVPAQVLVAPPAPDCLWCSRNDDLNNMVDVKIHAYHLQDLRRYLEATGQRKLVF